jgi:hypothetical protein
MRATHPAAQPIAHLAMTARARKHEATQMMTRTTTASVTGRASAIRRMRRRSHTANPAGRLYCATNGCASLLSLDPETGRATCAICGFTRQVH